MLAASVGLRRLPRCAAAGVGGGDAAARRHSTPTRSDGGSPLRRGAGIACMWYGIGNTVIANPSTMRGALRCDAVRGAHLFLYNGAQEIGQGTATIMPQMFADAVGLPLACVRAGDGRHRPAPPTPASRRPRARPSCRATPRRRRARLAPAADRAARLRRRGRCRASRLRARRRRRSSAASARRRSATHRPARAGRPMPNGDLLVGQRPLQSADGAARRRRPGRALRDLRLRGADRRGRGRPRARHGDGCCTSTPRTTSAAPSTRPRSKARSTAASRRASAWR